MIFNRTFIKIQKNKDLLTQKTLEERLKIKKHIHSNMSDQ